MLLSINHGARIVLVNAASPVSEQLAAAARAEPDRKAVTGADVAAAPRARRGASATGDGERFGYLFPDAPILPPIQGALLDALADAMAEQGAPSAASRSRIPAVMTYFGQFIDHDITANTDRDVGATFTIIGDTITPVDRDEVKKGLTNLRTGALDLDSVYGDGPFDHPLESLLRDGARMRLGVETDVMPSLPTAERPPLPTDAGSDLPRVGPLVSAGLLDASAVPKELLTPSLPASESRRALIGDARNDENLIVAQLHVAMLRFHNAVVAELAPQGLSERDLYEKARAFVRHTHQWLALNYYLPGVCDPAIVGSVLAQGAPLYTDFLKRHPQPSPGVLPLPLEFSVAAFRFGHSMVRGGYDHNRNFGAERKIAAFATLGDLFTFTGKSPTPFAPFAAAKTLPNNWIIEWSRFVGDTDEAHDARPIDTRLSATLLALPNEGEATPPLPFDERTLFKNLARRNLRRGWLLNLPSAQTLIERFGPGIIPQSSILTPVQLASGSTGAAVIAGGFETVTPLWFYILKEAEILHDGRHLGPLGSRLVAETLTGLVLNDADSYWTLKPGGSWRPADTLRPGGQAIAKLDDLLRVAGVL